MEIRDVGKLVLESMRELVYVRDLDKHLLYINPAAEELTGWAYSEAMEKKCYEVLGDCNCSCREVCPIETAIAAGQHILHHEGELKTRQGAVRKMQVSVSPFKENDKTAGAVVVMKDITDLHQLTQTHIKTLNKLKKESAARRDSEMRLHQAQAVARIGSWHLDIRKNKLSWSAETYRLFGIPNGTPVTLDHFFAQVHPDDIQKVNNAWQAAIQKKAPYDIDHRIVVETRLLWVHEKAEIEFDSNGIPLFAIGTVQDITSRRKEHEELMLFKSIVETSGEAIAVSDPDGHLLYINPAHRTLFGRDLPESGIINYRDYYPPESIDFLNREVSPALAEGKGWEGELEVLHATGKRFPLWERADSVFDNQGNMIFAFGLMHDLTEKRQTETLLRAERDLGRRLSETVSLNETLLVCLDEVIRLTRMDCGGIYLVNESDGSLSLCVHRGLSNSFAGYASYYSADSFNARIVASNKTVLIQSTKLPGSMDEAAIQEGLTAVAIAPVWSAGQLVACLNIASRAHSTISDATCQLMERMAFFLGPFIKQARYKEALENNWNDLERLFNSLNDFLFILDMEGRIIHHNSAVNSRLGYVGDELIGCHALSLHPPELREEAKQILADMINGTKETCLIPVQMKNGAILPVETKVKHSRFRGRQVLIGLSRDVSERKRLENQQLQLERREKQIEKEESLNRMAGSIAHLFNNMLGVVLGNLELAMDEIPEDRPVFGLLLQAMEGARRAADVSTKMLLYLGQSYRKNETMDLAALCRRHIDLFVETMPFPISVRKDLPAAGLFMRGDSGQIGQMITNLLLNAAESRMDGGNEIRVSLHLSGPPEIASGQELFPPRWEPVHASYANIEISDTGKGMSSTVIHSIFDPFYSSKFTGRGLGLAVVLGAVRAHRGAITVQSTVGHGTTFRVFLPLPTD